MINQFFPIFLLATWPLFYRFHLFSPLQELLEQAFPKQFQEAGQTPHTLDIFALITVAVIMRTSLLYIAANLAIASAQVLLITMFMASFLRFRNSPVDSQMIKLF